LAPRKVVASILISVTANRLQTVQDSRIVHCFRQHFGSIFPLECWEINPECGSLSRMAFDSNGPLITADNTMHNRESHSCSLPNRFRRKERLEDMFKHFRRHAIAVVTHGQNAIRSYR